MPATSSSERPEPRSQRLVIVGGRRLCGTIPVSGSKNAALAIFAGALLASQGTTTLHNLPAISDIAIMADVLRHLGAKVTFTDDRRSATIDATRLDRHEASADLVEKMRASFWVLGPLLARLGLARVAQPGGCNIGARPIDLHLKGLRALGATLDVVHGIVTANAPHGALRGATIYLDFPSVGATMNIMMAAALSPGQTVIENAAQEPDIEDLSEFLNGMGAQISGYGTGVLTVEGVESLHGGEHTVIPDRIEAGTLGLVAGITGGDVFLEGANAAHIRPVTLKMIETGMEIIEMERGVRCIGPEGRPRPTQLTALPHPGFPTDMQQAFTAYLTLADGSSVVTDKVYENRFRFLTELEKMGASTQANGRTAVITGVPKLLGADVAATDLRAGAALVLAGLAAEGQTRISSTEHLKRGYERLVEKLHGVGAQIWSEDEDGRHISEESPLRCSA